jgi:hypothetical protein
MAYTTLILSIAAILIAISSALSAKRSADAADRTANAADRQAKATEEQVDATRQQIEADSRSAETTRLIAERQNLPSITVGPAVINGSIKPDAIEFKNIGDGIANDLELAYQDDSVDNQVRLVVTSLAKDASVSVGINGSRAARSGLFLTYTTLFDRKYILSFKWNGYASQAVGLKLSQQS